MANELLEAETNGVLDFESGAKHYCLFEATAILDSEIETPPLDMGYYQRGLRTGAWNPEVWLLNVDSTHALTEVNFYDYLPRGLAVGESLTADKVEINNFFTLSGVVATLAAGVNEKAVYNQAGLPGRLAIGLTGNAASNQVDMKVLVRMVRV